MTSMQLLELPDRHRYTQLSAAQLRASFVIDTLFQQGDVQLAYVDLDRTVIGSAVPLHESLTLSTPEELRATHFTERRELGILNIGDSGIVAVNGASYPLAKRDALYVGRGAHTVTFASDDAAAPAEFYLLSYPAHAVHPCALVKAADSEPVPMGSPANANVRLITKLIHMESVPSCQLVLGFTQLQSGNVWNTMPPHTHMRRSEVYLYFDLGAEDRVMHLMGTPTETRHLMLGNKQVVISPGWSIHAGVGTANYSFCWGMGGENQVYSDMDALRATDLA